MSTARAAADARHGLGPWQPDPSAWIIGAMEKPGLVRDVVRVSDRRQQLRRTGAPTPRLETL